MPSLVGIECPTDRICIDDETRLEQAETLSQLAIADIEGKLELIHQWPADKIGSVTVLFVPEWLKEGMAYFLKAMIRDRSFRNHGSHIE